MKITRFFIERPALFWSLMVGIIIAGVLAFVEMPKLEDPAVATKQAMVAAIQIAIRKGGFASYRIALIVANAIARALLGRGLSLAANAALVRWLSAFAGPIGWAFTIAWTAVDIAGPAYRVTIPAVIQIAYMRTKAGVDMALLGEDSQKEINPNE